MNLPGCCPKCGLGMIFVFVAGSPVQVCPVCDIPSTYITTSNTGSGPANPSETDTLRAANAQLQSEVEDLRSANAMLRKMQPLVLEGDAARSFALAAELSETKQALDALRADIEAGRLVRMPCKIGDTVWALRSYHGIIRPQQGTVSEMYFRPDMTLHIVVKHVARGEFGKTIFLSRPEAEEAVRAAKEAQDG